MAEFKLGRIKFVWKGDWSSSTSYFKDDVIRYGGRTYICQVGHTSAENFDTDLNFNPTKWNQMTDGQDWKGDWSTGTTYKINDVVKYGGLLYICNTSHTSAATVALGLENDISNWTLYAEGFDWKGDWDLETRYKRNDIVKYGGYTYVCNEGHTSANTENLGLEEDSSKWDSFNQGIEYKGTWAIDTRYKENDVVKYGAGLWICVTPHTSGAGTFADEEGNWDQFVKGFEFENDWSDAAVYQPGDVVVYGGNLYISKTNHTNFVPSVSTTNWDLFTEGFNFVGVWDSGTEYKPGDVVRLGGNTYVCTAITTGNEPPNISYWNTLTTGLNWRGLWIDDVEYKIGDVVRYLSNVYVCVQNHISEGDDGSTIGADPEGGGNADSRPDQDATGTYWNVLAIGSETDVLVERGDLIYFGGAGPSRLPVGNQGQVLVAGEQDPEWRSLGAVEYVYYVAPHGTDSPAPIFGKTWDQPFKTTRYACEQIEKGALNPNAQRLLELNRAFIQKEITAWIRYQIDNDISPFTSSFDYDEYKCERDVGIVLDKIQWDIGHGGNLKTRAAAQSFVDALGEGPFSDESEDKAYLTLSAEADEGVAAYTYLLTLAQSILDNEAPDTIYQNVSDDSTAIASQYIDTEYTAEAGTDTRFASLLQVIINTLEDQDTSRLPARSVPQYLVKASTGEHLETLPIRVPAYTAILGDELRSTRFKPKPASIDYSDAYYTTETFDHLTDVIGKIVTGTTVSATTGNNEAQDQSFPVADTVEQDVVEQLIQVMKLQSELKTETTNSYNLPDPTGYNASYLIGYGNARKLVKENKRFFQEEVIAWFTANYPNLKYGKTEFKKNISNIIDALVYDLTYDGNALSVKTGLSYYEGTGGSLNISASIKPFTLLALGFLKTRVNDVILGNSITPLNDEIVNFTDTAGSAASATLVGNNLDDIIEIIDTGPSAVGTSVTLTDPTPADGVNSTTALINAYSTLNSAASTISSDTVSWINANYPSLTYNSSDFADDVESVIKSAGFDFMFNSTYQTNKEAYAYLRKADYNLNQKQVIREAIEYALTNTNDGAVANVGGNADAIARINNLAGIIDNIIYGASNEGEVCQTDIRNRDYAILKLEENRDFIVAEVSAYITETYGNTATNTTASTNVITIGDTSNLVRNAAIKFTGTTFGGIEADTTYYVQNVVSSTTFTIATARNSNTPVTLTTASGSMGLELAYNRELCLRDVNTYIDALKFDLRYTSNYESRYVSRYYANAVIGSHEEDMFYLRDATGLRNCSVDGLQGDLLPENEYGTSRVSAGAYCSLDPGWGPDDFRTWIITRSPYVQGVSTFGSGAIGQKIDGALHNGGNDSIVSNDFTQVISDGIGAWIANNGRAELVSVFSYYAHIGYLATDGGRIRGTNGNNSYGDFGSVAEGFDETEVPNTAVVDNVFQFEATIGNIFTDGSELFNFEFENAGQDYTEVAYTITGGGAGAVVEQDEFRDGAVHNIRLLDFGDDSSGQFGGDGYITNSNTAQAGTLSEITIAATDPQTSTDYPGMRIQLTGGSGVGQVGIINTYNSGTKVATVTRESDGQAGWDHVIPGTTIVAPDASTTYIIEPALSFTPPVTEIETASLPVSGSWKDAVYGDTATSYVSLTPDVYSGEGTGASFIVIRNGTKYSLIEIQNSGTDYSRLETITINGSNLGGEDSTNDITITITAVDANGAITNIDTAGSGAGGRFVAVNSVSSNAGAYSNDGLTWSAMSLPATATWSAIGYGLIDDGSSYGKSGRFVALATGSTTAAYSDDGINWLGSVLPTSDDWNAVAYGDSKFVAIATDSTTVAISGDGVDWDQTGTLPSTGFVDVVYGKGVWVAVKPGNTGAIAYATDPTGTWTAANMPASSNWNSITYGLNMFIAVATDSNTGAYSLSGTADWTSMTMGSPDSTDPAGYEKVRYGQGVFVATMASTELSGYHNIAKSENGLYWTFEGVTDQEDSSQTTGFSALAFGNPSQVGYWVALNKETNTHAVRVKTGAKPRARASVAENKIFQILITEPGSGYTTPPTMTITDPNNIFEAPFSVRLSNGALANPSFVDRGTGYQTGSAEVDTGDGFADFFQSGSFVAIRRLTQRPSDGSNVVFDHLPNRTFKLVNVITFLGETDGTYTAFLQVSPALTVAEAPDHLTGVTTRALYSQVRLTGHDFLDIGTGNFVETNYPGEPTQDPIPANETVENNGGRVFYTSTDQDGNFRVGDLFNIEQSTGVATLNADAFNIAGLQELNLGEVTLGGGSATVTEFSTDPFFTEDSDNVVPTQRAVKAFIASQIGGGGASLNVNSVTAGSINIAGNTITTVTGVAIQMNATFEFRGGVTGIPLAVNYFLD